MDGIAISQVHAMDTHAMDAHAMDAHDPSHTDSRIALPRKEARILNLKKCKFCRARKVKVGDH